MNGQARIIHAGFADRENWGNPYRERLSANNLRKFFRAIWRRPKQKRAAGQGARRLKELAVERRFSEVVSLKPKIILVDSTI